MHLLPSLWLYLWFLEFPWLKYSKIFSIVHQIQWDAHWNRTKVGFVQPGSCFNFFANLCVLKLTLKKSWSSGFSLKYELQDQLIKVNFNLPNFTESHQTKCSNICSQFCLFVFMLISLSTDRFLSLYADNFFGLFILFLVVMLMHCRYLCYFNEVV